MKKYFKREQLPLYIVGIISLVVVGFVVNYTYSFFAVNKTNNNVIAGEAESMSIDLKVEKKAPNNDNKLVPQLDEYITSAVKGVNGSCVDGNNNNVCQVYKITVKNGGSTTTQLNGEVVLDAKNNPNLKWAVISGEASWTKPILKSNVYSHTHKQLTTKEEYTGGQTKEYYIVVWISETGLGQEDTGKFTGVVNFTNVNAGGGSWETTSIDNSGANVPAYTEGLMPVMYDESRSAWVKADTTSSESEYGWYDYDNKKWANAVLVKDSWYNPVLEETNKSVNVVNSRITSYDGNVYSDYGEENTATFTFTTGPSGGELSFDYEMSAWDPKGGLYITLNGETIVNDHPDVRVLSVVDEEAGDYGMLYYTYKRVTKTLAPNTEYTMIATFSIKDSDNDWFGGNIYDISLPNDLASELTFSTSEPSDEEEYVLYWDTLTDNKIKSFGSYEILENGKFMLKEDDYSNYGVIPRDFDEFIIGRYICSDGVSVECDTIYQIKAISGNAITSVDSYVIENTSRNTISSSENGTIIDGGGILAHYVWIPRYKYRVWNINQVDGESAYAALSKGIDIVFEEGTSTTGDVECTYDFSKTIENSDRNEECTGVNGESYYTHPAFTFGDDELTGIWVGKYELSSDYGTLIKPGLFTSKQDFYNIGEVHNLAKSMQGSNNIYGLSTDLTVADSHMINNMEWGVMAYLSRSKYGMCNGSMCNSIEFNMTDNEFAGALTGVGGSTTNNVYGIYDTVGGAWDMVMGNVSSVRGSYVFDVGYSGFSYNDDTAKYLTTYSYSLDSDDDGFIRTRLGDGIGEVYGGDDWFAGYCEEGGDCSQPWIRRGPLGRMFEDGDDIFGVFPGWDTLGYDDTSRFVLAVFP